MRRSLALSAAAGLAVAAFASGCSIGPAKPPANAAPVDRSPFVLPSPSPLRPRALLTGLETEESTVAKPVVLVPIEVGTGAAAPRGLDRADLVELEFAEGKLLRLGALFQSQTADRVGPVASVRPADVKLLNQLRPYVAHHGTPKGFLDLLNSSKLRAVTPGKTGFVSVSGRVFADTGALQASAPAEDKLPSSLFQFGQPGEPVAATGVTTAGTVVVTVPGHTALTWKFDAATKRWQTAVGGVPVNAANLVFLTTGFTKKDVKALDREVAMAEPVGKGVAQVYTTGQGVTAQWHKDGFYSAFKMLGPEQSIIRLAPGPTWVLLIPSTAKVTAS
jgi:hypothetical protein